MRINPIGASFVRFGNGVQFGSVKSATVSDSFEKKTDNPKPITILNIFGPQACGKGTQAVLLSKHYNIPQISTGDIFRAIMKGNYDYGNIDPKVIEDAILTVNRGDLVDDETTNKILFERLSRDDCKNGYILDGYPRNREQAIAYDEYLSEKPSARYRVICLDVPREVLYARLAQRAIEQGRIDDADPVVIENRLRTYDNKTAPLLDYYKEKGCLKTVQGDANIDTVFEQVLEASQED